MSGETEVNVSGWTTDTLKVYFETMFAAHDRRYTELAIEREKALRIKQRADEQALQLARDIQTYKDMQANELRDQINRERLLYATKEDLMAITEKIEATLKPLADYVTAQQGGPRALTPQAIYGGLGALAVLVAVANYLAAH